MLVDEGRFLMSEEVVEEIKKKTAAVSAWCKPRETRMVVRTTNAVANTVTEILDQHKRLVMNLKGRNRADPFVVAVAKIRGAIVVTGEGSDGTADRPKIPYVCAQLGIPCIRFLDVIRREKWRF